jgi:hypothetical protein
MRSGSRAVTARVGTPEPSAVRCCGWTISAFAATARRQDGIDVVGDDVDGVGPTRISPMDAAGLLGRAKHDCAAGGPAQLGMDGISVVAIDGDRSARAERIDRESQRAGRVVVVQDGPHG